MTPEQKFHQARTRAQQALNAAVIRFNVGIGQKDPVYAERAAQDMAQAVDDLLALVGAPVLTGSGQQLDCPDCGQYLGE